MSRNGSNRWYQRHDRIAQREDDMIDPPDRQRALSAAREAVVAAAVAEREAQLLHEQFDDCGYEERCRRERAHWDAEAARVAAVDALRELEQDRAARGEGGR